MFLHRQYLKQLPQPPRSPEKKPIISHNEDLMVRQSLADDGRYSAVTIRWEIVSGEIDGDESRGFPCLMLNFGCCNWQLNKDIIET